MSIILVGRSGAGKSSISRELALLLNYKVYEVGDFVKYKYKQEQGEVLECRDILDTTRGGTSKLVHSRLDYVNEKCQLFGHDYFVREMLKEIPDEAVVLCGLRSGEEVQHVRSKWPHAFFVGIFCDEEVLLSRYLVREKEKFESIETAKMVFDRRRQLEAELGIYEIQTVCDYTINTCDVDIKTATNLIVTAYKRKRVGN